MLCPLELPAVTVASGSSRNSTGRSPARFTAAAVAMKVLAGLRHTLSAESASAFVRTSLYW